MYFKFNFYPTIDYLLYYCIHLHVSLSLVAPVGQTLVPSFGDILSPTNNNQSLLSSLPTKMLDLQHSRKVNTIMKTYR